RVVPCPDLSAEVWKPSWRYDLYSDLPECAIGSPCGPELQRVRIADRDQYSRRLGFDLFGRCDNHVITSGRVSEIIHQQVGRRRTQDVERNIRITQYFPELFCSIRRKHQSVPV